MTASPERARIGSYQLASVIGRGAMGVVYRAEHVETGQRVALKMSAHTSEESLAALRREIHAVSRIRHPGIVQIVDQGVEEGLPWFAMELLEGPTLRDRLDETWSAASAERGLREERLDELLVFFAGLCGPLASLHEHGVVHGDLKPDNVHVGGGNPVLVDFGLFANFASTAGREALAVSGGIAGTSSYLAPEQIWGELIDARADLYSLGCMLYEAITGRPPFVGEGPGEILQQHLYSEVRPPSELASGIATWLDELVLRLLRKSRRDRLGYAEVVAGILGRHIRSPSPRTISASARPYLYRSELAGRTEDLARIRSLVLDASRGTGGLFFISGESGIGKTRLAMEAARFAAHNGLTTISGECSAVGGHPGETGPMLHAFRPFLAALADRCRREGREETDRLLGARGPILAPYEPSFSHLPGQRDQPAPPLVSPEAALERLEGAFLETLVAWSEKEPLLLVVDDLQAADELSLRLVSKLQDLALGALPILVLATYRADEVGESLRTIVDRAEASTLQLDRLGQREIQQIVGDMLALSDVPTDLVSDLFAETEGNPFFLSEYLLAAVGAEVLRRDDLGEWKLAPQGEARGRARTLAIPRAIEDLVRLRLEALDDDARALVETGSVLGRSFAEGHLTNASALGDARAMEAIQDLLQRRIWSRERGGELRFVHGKLREVAYGRIPETAVRERHLRAAVAIEAGRDLAALSADDEVLAHHWEKAAGKDLLTTPDSIHAAGKAIGYLGRAAEEAYRHAAYRSSIDLVGRAISLNDRSRAVEDVERIAEWYRLRGAASLSLGDFDASARSLAKALELIGEPVPASTRGYVGAAVGQLVRQFCHRVLPAGILDRSPKESALLGARIHEHLTQILHHRQETLALLYSIVRRLNLAELAAPSAQRAHAYAVAASVAEWSSLHSLGERYYRLSQQALGEEAESLDRGILYETTAIYRAGMGHLQESEERLQEALGLFDRIGDRRRWHESLSLLGIVLLLRGESARAAEIRDQVLAEAASRGDRQIQLWGSIERGEVLLRFGRSAEALQSLIEAKSLLDWSDRAEEIWLFGLMAVAELREQRPDQAVEAAERALAAMSGGAAGVFYLLDAYSGVAEVGVALAAEAANLAERAVDRMRGFATHFPIGIPRARLWQGVHAARSGRAARAQKLWQEGLRAAERLSVPYDEGLLRHRLALEMKEPERSAALRRSEELFCRVGAARELEALRRDLVG